MGVIKTFKLISILPLCAISLQSFIVNADQVTNNLNLSPIITIKEKDKDKENKEKEPPAPGLSFGAPSAYGAGGGSVFLGISYGADGQDGLFTFYNKDNEKVADGSMNFGFGIGDPNKLAAEVSVGIISMSCQDGESCFGADGTMGLKLHRKLEGQFVNGIGFGYSDLVRWGQASDFATLYGVASKDLKIKNKDGLLSVGIGTGSFRSKADMDSNKNNPNLFGGIGVKLSSRLSLASSWNGSTLGAGFGISPFDFPLSVSAGVTDITDVNGKGYQYSINIGYSLNF